MTWGATDKCKPDLHQIFARGLTLGDTTNGKIHKGWKAEINFFLQAHLAV